MATTGTTPVTLTAGTVTLLGPGPMRVQCAYGVALYTAAASAPPAIIAGQALEQYGGPNCPWELIDNTNNVYATAVNGTAEIVWEASVPGSSGGGGSVTQGSSPWVDNITQFGGANVVTGTGTSGAGIPRVTVSSDSFPSTQPISGTVTANFGTLNGAATAANQTNVQSAAGTAAGTLLGIQGGGTGALPLAVSWTGQTVTLGAGANNIGSITNITGTVPLPAGAATAANQNSTVAGTSSASAQGVQGVTGGVPLPVSGALSQTTGATITTSQPSITTTAGTLAFSGTAHREIQNLGTAPIYIGASGVTTTTGYPVQPGSSYDATRFSGTLYAVAAATQSAALISY